MVSLENRRERMPNRRDGIRTTLNCVRYVITTLHRHSIINYELFCLFLATNDDGANAKSGVYLLNKIDKHFTFTIDSELKWRLFSRRNLEARLSGAQIEIGHARVYQGHEKIIPKDQKLFINNGLKSKVKIRFIMARFS